jgi:hypothetical protein
MHTRDPLPYGVELIQGLGYLVVSMKLVSVNEIWHFSQLFKCSLSFLPFNVLWGHVWSHICMSCVFNMWFVFPKLLLVFLATLWVLCTGHWIFWSISISYVKCSFCYTAFCEQGLNIFYTVLGVCVCVCAWKAILILCVLEEPQKNNNGNSRYSNHTLHAGHIYRIIIKNGHSSYPI